MNDATPQSTSKEYLGDSVYIQKTLPYEGYTLTTENGDGPSNTIMMDWSVLRSLICYMKRHNPEIWEILTK